MGLGGVGWLALRWVFEMVGKGGSWCITVANLWNCPSYSTEPLWVDRGLLNVYNSLSKPPELKNRNGIKPKAYMASVVDLRLIQHSLFQQLCQEASAVNFKCRFTSMKEIWYLRILLTQWIFDICLDCFLRMWAGLVDVQRCADLPTAWSINMLQRKLREGHTWFPLLEIKPKINIHANISEHELNGIQLVNSLKVCNGNVGMTFKLPF